MCVRVQVFVQLLAAGTPLKRQLAAGTLLAEVIEAGRDRGTPALNQVEQPETLLRPRNTCISGISAPPALLLSSAGEHQGVELELSPIARSQPLADAH